MRKMNMNKAARVALGTALFERDRTVVMTHEGRQWLRAAKAREMRAAKLARATTPPPTPTK